MNAKFAEWLENIYVDYLCWAIDQRFKNRNDEYEKMAEWFNQHMHDYGEIPSQSDDIKQMKIGGINNAILQDEALNSYLKKSNLESYATLIADELPQGVHLVNNEFTLDTVKSLIKQAVKLGTQWQKEQLLKDAISCNVFWHDGPLLDYTQEQQDDVLEKIGAEVGDKVKIIILKDNDKRTQNN